MKKRRTLYGLSKWKYDYQEVNNSTIFSISDMPNSLKVGKNSFKLLASKNKLLKGSEIFIDIIDSNSNPIYFEVSNLVNSDGTRNVVIFIYEDTSPGKSIIQMSGTLITGEKYLFQKEISVETDKSVDNDIVFSYTPKLILKERLQPAQNRTSTSRFRTQVNSTGSVSIVSTVKPRKFEDSNIEFEKTLLQDTDTKISISNNIITQTSIGFPKYSDFSIMTSKGFTFESQMEGGTIDLNKISLQYPGDASDISLFQSKSYNGNILKVRNSSSIEIYPPLKFDIKYNNINSESKLYSTNKLYNHTNFTVSYYQYLPNTNSFTTQSFITVDFYDLSPEIGLIDRIGISYKATNQFGDYIQIGESEVNPINLFTSTSSIQFDQKNGIIEKSIGDFRNGLSDFSTNWFSQSFGTGSCVVDTKKLRIIDGIRIYQTSSRGIADRWLIKPKSSIEVAGNSNYLLQFKSFDDPDEVYNTKPQVDIYISGSSSIKPDLSINLPEYDYIPFRSASYGTYIGSANGYSGRHVDRNFKFSTIDSGSIMPIFVFRSGVWQLGNITISPDEEKGYTPNQFRLNIPLIHVPKNSELVLKFDYINPIGKESEYSSFLYGVYFTGSSADNDRVIQKVGKSEKITYLCSIEDVSITPSSSNNIVVYFPSLLDEFGTPYTGSSNFIGMTYDVRTVLLGRSGSLDSIIDSYTWAGTSQGRILITPSYNNGIPFMYDRIDFSGSSDNRALGTYGTSTTKPNFDSWFRVTGIQAQDGYMRVTYTLRVSASVGLTSALWKGSGTSICEISKYETNY